ncbi:MAG TPA: hypothetical protein VE197_16050, partial [Mycobacterium sp.]|nr:hypothetical protein [Mycobacterium sp.]
MIARVSAVPAGVVGGLELMARLLLRPFWPASSPGVGCCAMAALDALDDWPVETAAAAIVGPAGVLATHGDTRHEFALASVTKPLVARAAH